MDLPLLMGDLRKLAVSYSIPTLFGWELICSCCEEQTVCIKSILIINHHVFHLVTSCPATVAAFYRACFNANLMSHRVLHWNSFVTPQFICLRFSFYRSMCEWERCWLMSVCILEQKESSCSCQCRNSLTGRFRSQQLHLAAEGTRSRSDDMYMYGDKTCRRTCTGGRWCAANTKICQYVDLLIFFFFF